MDHDAFEAEFGVEQESGGVADVGVDAQHTAALFAGVSLVKLHHRTTASTAARNRIDSESVHHHHLVGAGVHAPGRKGVIIALKLVEHSGADDLLPVFSDKKIVAVQGVGEGLCGWINAAFPTDGGVTGFFSAEGVIVERFECRQIVGSGFAECELHGTGLLCTMDDFIIGDGR